MVAYMIKKIIQKVPVGLMIVPLLLASFINTFFPSIYELGPFAGAFANPYGVNAIMATSLVFVGGQLTFKRMKLAFKRGVVLFMSKFIGGLIICFISLSMFGIEGAFGISILALACALTNQNNSLFIGQITDYGDGEDLASAAVTALISTPMTTIIALAMLGLTELNTNSLIDIFIPITAGFILANLDENVSDFFGKTQYYMLPFMGFALGSSINW